MRGESGLTEIDEFCIRLTPAHAGRIRRVPQAEEERQVDPRTCGENHEGDKLWVLLRG